MRSPPARIDDSRSRRGRVGVGACLHTLGARAGGAPTTCLTGMSTVAYRHLAQQGALFGCHPRTEALPRVLLARRSWLAVSRGTAAVPLPASDAASFRCSSREIGGVYGLYCQIPIRTPQSIETPLSRAWLYALHTTGVNHMRISGYNRYGCCCG
jgi:hypothetical protein